MAGPWEAYAAQPVSDGPWSKYTQDNSTPGLRGVPNVQVQQPDFANNKNIILPQPGSQVEEPTTKNKFIDLSNTVMDANNALHDSFASGMGQMAGGVRQILANNSDNPEDKAQQQQYAGQLGAIGNQLQNKAIGENATFGTAGNLASKAAATAPAAVLGLPGLIGGGAVLGGLTPNVSPEDQAQYPTTPQTTMLGRATAPITKPLGEVNNAIASVVTSNPNSTLGKAVQGALGAGELAGVTKVGAGVLNKVIPDSYDTFLAKNANLDQDALRAKANETYSAAAAAGGNIGADHVNNWVSNALNTLPQEEETKGIFGQSKAENIISNLENLKDKPLSFKAAQEIDTKLGNAIENETDPVTGKVSGDGQKLIEVRQGLKDTIENIPDQPGFELLNQAKQLWSAQAKAGDIQRILDKASYSDNQATAIKNGFKALATNPTRLRGYTPEEVAAIKTAATTGIVTGVLKTAGSRLGSLIAGGVGLAHGGPIGALAAFSGEHAVGAGARGVADSIQAGKGQAVLDQIGQRPAVQNAFGLKPVTPLVSQGVRNSITQAAVPLVAKTAATQAQQQFQPIQQSSQQQGFADQVKAPDVTSFAKPESNNNPNAKNPNSTASGAFQFTNKTWANMVMKYGKQTGITMADKNNPQAQATMARLYALDNIDTLKPSLGRMPTKGELYMAHVFGADGAKKLIQAPAEKEAALLFPRNVIDANHNLFFDKQTKQPRTAGQLYQLLASRI